MSESIYKNLEAPFYCMECHKSYGPIGLSCQDRKIWVTCDCTELGENEVAFIDTNNISFGETGDE